MIEKARGGYLTLHVQLLNGRLFQRLLNQESEALYRSEQGKILSSLWEHSGEQTATDIALQTGLANNTLTSMLKRLEIQGLLQISEHPNDKRKKLVRLTEVGWQQQKIGEKVSQELADIFYADFSEEEIMQYEAYLERILKNLQTAIVKKP